MFLVVWMVLLFRPLMLDFCIVIGDEALTGGGEGGGTGCSLALLV